MSTEKESSTSQATSWFPSMTTPAPVRDLIGRTAIVTGSNSGIGLECAKELYTRGISKLILAVRDEAEGAAAKSYILSTTTSSQSSEEDQDIEVWPLDYCSYKSIADFTDRAETLQNLDIVILNAGVYRVACNILPQTGHEEVIQVNYLSTALLAILLLPTLRMKKRSASQPGTLTMVSSSVAEWAKFKLPEEGRPVLSSLDEKLDANTFDHHQQYCTSKLLGQFFLVELAKRVPSSTAFINCVNPGLCYGSNLARDSQGTFMGYLARAMFRVCGRSCASGAQAIVNGAVQHDVEFHGRYVNDGKPALFAPIVYTDEGKVMAERLWEGVMKEFKAEGVIRGLSQEMSG